jgi:hypothetical protein
LLEELEESEEDGSLSTEDVDTPSETKDFIEDSLEESIKLEEDGPLSIREEEDTLEQEEHI